MPSDEDACNICEGDRSTTKNPIIFCDGKGCNMPVHKLCYNVKQIPEDEWYCQRCEYKKRKKAANIICCPMQTGAIKKTTVTGDYMHVVCAIWNQSINSNIEPYVVNKSLLDKYECYYCEQHKGLTIHCEEPNCNIRFHATCGINNSLIIPAASVPTDFIPKCSKHQTIYYKKTSTSKSKGKRRLRRNDSEDEESEEEESEEQDDSEEESQEAKGDDSEEEEEEDSDEDERRKDRKKKPLMISGNSNKSKPPATSAPITPMKRRASPQSLFPEDQQSSDDDDDMGTSSSSASKPKLNTFNNKTSTNLAIGSSAATVPPSASTQPSYKERLEAKRKKSAIESRPQPEDMKKPLTITPPPVVSAAAASSNSSTSLTGVTQKQKLPNRAHLTYNNNGVVGNGIRSSNNNTPPGSMKRFNGPGVIKDIDEIYNETKAQQRWNNNSNTPLHHPQPTTPHTIPPASFFENDVAKNNAGNNSSGQRKSMDWKPMNGGEKEDLFRLREENRKLIEFKNAVSEVFSTLGVSVPAGVQPDFDHVESYVAQLQSILRRSGFTEQDRIQIKECTKGLHPPNTTTNNQ